MIAHSTSSWRANRSAATNADNSATLLVVEAHTDEWDSDVLDVVLNTTMLDAAGPGFGLAPPSV
jgi:hypothetical protein